LLAGSCGRTPPRDLLVLHSLIQVVLGGSAVEVVGDLGGQGAAGQEREVLFESSSFAIDGLVLVGFVAFVETLLGVVLVGRAAAPPVVVLDRGGGLLMGGVRILQLVPTFLDRLGLLVVGVVVVLGDIVVDALVVAVEELLVVAMVG